MGKPVNNDHLSCCALWVKACPTLYKRSMYCIKQVGQIQNTGLSCFGIFIDMGIGKMGRGGVIKITN